MAASRRPEPARQRSISDELFASNTEQAQLAYMEQMYGTINLLNAELESERRSRAALEAARPATYPAKPDYATYEDDVQIPVGEFDEPPSGFIVSQTPVAPSYSPRKLRTMPSPPSQPPQTQHRVARPPVSPRSPLAKDQDEELCATLGKNAELRIRSRDMERTVEKTELELELARKQIKMAERRAENREEKLRALLKEKLSWQKELKATRAQVVEEKMRQVDLFREVEAAKRHFAAELEAVDQELRAAQEENAQLRTHAAEMKAQMNFQTRKMEDMARQAQDEKARFVSMIEETRHRFREWKEGEAAELEDAHEQVMRNLKTEYELKLERHQDEKQKLRDKVNDLEVSMRLLQKDRALSPLELSLRKAAILGGKEHTGAIEAEQIESQSRILELENLLAHSREYQLRQESIIKLSESTISRLMQEREVTALENLSLHPFGVEPQRPEDFSYESQLTGFVTAPSSPLGRLSSPGTPPRSHQSAAKVNEPAVVRSPKSRAHTPKRADLEASIAQAADAASTASQKVPTDPSSREQSLMEELALLRKELLQAQAKAASASMPSCADSSTESSPCVVDAEIPQAETSTAQLGTTESSSAQDATEFTFSSLQNGVTAEPETEHGGQEAPEAESEEPAETGERQSDSSDKVPFESPLLQEGRSTQNADDERHSDSIVNDDVVPADESDAAAVEEIEQPEEIALSERDTLVIEEEAVVATGLDDRFTDPNAPSKTDADVSLEPSGLCDEAIATGAALEDAAPLKEVDATQNEEQPSQDPAPASQMTPLVQDSVDAAPAAVEPVPSPALQAEDIDSTDPENCDALSKTAEDGELVVWDVDAVALASQEHRGGAVASSSGIDTDEQEGLATDTRDDSLEVLHSQGETTNATNEDTVDVEEDAANQATGGDDTAEAALCDTDEASETSNDLESDQNIGSTDPQHNYDELRDAGELADALDADSAAVGAPPCTLEPQEPVEKVSIELDSSNDNAPFCEESSSRTEETEALTTQPTPVEAEQPEDGELSPSVVSVPEEASQGLLVETPSVGSIPRVPDVTSLSLETTALVGDEPSALDEVPMLTNSDAVVSEALEQCAEVPAGNPVDDTMEAAELPAAALPEVTQPLPDDRSELEAAELSGTDDALVEDDEVARTPENVIHAVEATWMPADDEKSSEDALSSQGCAVPSQDGADLTQTPENPSVDNEEGDLDLVSDPAHLAETIVAEALVALVEGVALSLARSHREDSADTSEASHELSMLAMEDDVAAPVKTFDPVSVRESPPSSVVDGVGEYEQDVDCFVELDDAGDATEDIDEAAIAGDEQQAARVEEPAMEKGSSAPNDPALDGLVVLMAKAFAENVVREVMDMFSLTPHGGHQKEGEEIVVEDVTVTPAGSVAHDASDFAAEETAQLAERELEMESGDIDADESATAVPVAAQGSDDRLEQQHEGESVEEVSAETSADHLVQIAGADVNLVAPDVPEELIQDATDESVPAVDTLAVARDFVDAVETQALSSVLIYMYMQNGGSADGGHGSDETESDTTRSINESCTLSPEEQEETNEVDAESDFPVEGATEESTSDTVDNWVDEAIVFMSEAVDDTDAVRDEDDKAGVADEVSRVVQRCVEAVEREARAAFVATDTTSELPYDAHVTVAHTAEEAAVSISSGLSPQKIVSDVACLFASLTIAEVLSRLSHSCPSREDEAALEESEPRDEATDERREWESVVDTSLAEEESFSIAASDGEGLAVASNGRTEEELEVTEGDADSPLMERLGNEEVLATDEEAEKLLTDQCETMAVAAEASVEPEEPTDVQIAGVLEVAQEGALTMDMEVNDEANPLPEDDDETVKLVLEEMVDDIAAGDAVYAAHNISSDVTQECISEGFPGEVNLLADAARTVEVDEPFDEVSADSEAERGCENDQSVLIDETRTLSACSGASVGPSNDASSPLYFTIEKASDASEPLPPTADAVEATEGVESDVESTMRDIVDAVEIANQVESTCSQLSVEEGHFYNSIAVTPSDDEPEEGDMDPTVKASFAAKTSDESTEMIAAAMEEQSVVLATEVSESLGTNVEVPEATNKQSDIEAYAGVPVGLSLEEEADVQLALERILKAVAADVDAPVPTEERAGPSHQARQHSLVELLDGDNFAELSTDSAPVEPEVLNAVVNLCASVERATAPRYPGRARSVHFACGFKDEKPDRLGQMRRSVLLWQAPIDTACSKEAVESAVKRRASKRRTSRRTFADLLAFPTEMARFASSDTTLLAYDARHEQGEIFSLLDHSILTINPHGRHIHLDDQDERVGSQIIGKRKTLTQELHSKNLALRQIPRFNYTPMRIKFQWSDFVVASPVRLSNSDLSISKSPVEPMRLLQKRGAKLPCGSYVVVSAFIRPLEDGNENLRVQIYDAERVEEFQFDFSEDIMKKYLLEATGMEAQSLEFLGHLEFRRDEESIIIKLPEKKAGDGAKLEGDRIQSERTMVGGADLRKREPKQNRMSAYRHQRPASSPEMTTSHEPPELSTAESDAEIPGSESNVAGSDSDTLDREPSSSA
jgi:hypothetical protein